MFRLNLLSLFLLLLVSVLFQPIVSAQDSIRSTYFTEQRISKIDKYVEQSMRENRVPGVAIALLESGKVVHLKGFGAADRLGRKVTPQIPFQVASVTKSFTSLLSLIHI